MKNTLCKTACGLFVWQLAFGTFFLLLQSNNAIAQETKTSIESRFSVDPEKVLAEDDSILELNKKLYPLRNEIGLVFTESVKKTNFVSFALKFNIESSPITPNWKIRILNNEKKEIQSITSGDLKGKTEFWSERIMGSTAYIELYNYGELGSEGDLKISIGKAFGYTKAERSNTINKIKEFFKGIFKTNEIASVIDDDEIVPIVGQKNEIIEAGKAVIKIATQKALGRFYNCTGFLISKDLVVTNNHCIGNDKERRSSVYSLDFDSDGSETFPPGEFKELVLTSKNLDFTILRLYGPISPDRKILKLASRVPNIDQELIIIQHPEGKPKMVSILGCRVVDWSGIGVEKVPYNFAHKCDTKKSSSGSPILESNQLEVIGVHYDAFDNDKKTLANVGVESVSIVKCIQLKEPNLLKELSFFGKFDLKGFSC